MDLAQLPREVLYVAVAVLLVLVVVQWAVRTVGNAARRGRMMRRMHRASWGEARTPEWLSEHGFVVTGSQVSVSHVVCLDDREIEVLLRADFLVERDQKRFVVEVKTGARAPKLETTATRRQILEYLVAFDVDGVILVDAEKKTLHMVRFPSLERLANGASC